ncbi:uncharacterized protein Dana_GF16505, isoform C [Drosophila ananassae]|uniref:Uncharacterized protein, isoform C n=1 Tax=Drosophila ananassae TaxID=7217 RepID=A0A0N8P1L8_DROAN|nr:uncharacterized protein Dana_GF16505, isoform C [Drosophila ananassae]
MFVKIKLENEVDGKQPHIFELVDTATILDLKAKMERIVNIAIDHQEIRSLSRWMQNGEKLSTLLLDQEHDKDPAKNGAAISLLNQGEFVCFLQFYSRTEAGAQQNFFSQPRETKLMPVERPPQYCELSDSQDSSSSDQSESSYDSSSTDGSSTIKRTRSSEEKEPLAKRRLPIYPNVETPTLPTRSVSLSNNTPKSVTGMLLSKAVASARSCNPDYTSEQESEDQENKGKEQVFKDEVRTLQNCKRTKCDHLNTSPPYATTFPEKRRYGLVISNKDQKAEDVDLKAIMEHFFDVFGKVSEQALNFSNCTAMAKFCSNLLIVCEDEPTVKWVMSAVAGVTPPHSCLSFIKFFGLIRTSFVLPLIVVGKPLSSIFELLETQNCGLVTSKWTVVARKLLDPSLDNYSLKAVSVLCDNEQIEVYIDEESKKIIVENSGHINYCFWKLRFQFAC